MTNHTHNYPACANCAFAPFCLNEGKSSRRAKHVNLVVKQHRLLKRNEIVCLPNSRFQNLYAIQQGAFKTYQAEADGKELIRGFYFTGEIFGYEAIHTGHYLFSAVALADTIVCEIPYHNLLQILHSKPSLQQRLLNLISQQLSTGSYLACSSAEQRLAAFLIDLSSRLHPLKKKLDFLLPMSRQDIGNYLGLTAETISRIFSRFQKNNIIAIDHKKIQFLEPKQLELIADGLYCA